MIRIAALKRVNWFARNQAANRSSTKLSTRSVINIPMDDGVTESRLKLPVVSDSYPGIEWDVSEASILYPIRETDRKRLRWTLTLDWQGG